MVLNLQSVGKHPRSPHSKSQPKRKKKKNLIFAVFGIRAPPSFSHRWYLIFVSLSFSGIRPQTWRRLKAQFQSQPRMPIVLTISRGNLMTLSIPTLKLVKFKIGSSILSTITKIRGYGLEFLWYLDH